jgi:hypothetical protein
VGNRDDGLRARLQAWSLFMDNDRTFNAHEINPSKDDIRTVLSTAICSQHKWLFFGLHKDAIYVSIYSYDKIKFKGDLIVDDETTKYIVGKFTRDHNDFLLGNKPMPNEIMRVVSGDKLVDHLCDIFSNKNQIEASNILQFKKVK